MDLKDLWPDWMHEGNCFSTSPVPKPLRVVVTIEGGKELLSCGHLTVPLFPETNAPDRSYHRLCTDCGADPDPFDLFMPRKGGRVYEQIEVAKSICYGDEEYDECPVREECLEFAIKTKQTQGIWGGLSSEERSKVKRRASRKRKYIDGVSEV